MHFIPLWLLLVLIRSNSGKIQLSLNEADNDIVKMVQVQNAVLTETVNSLHNSLEELKETYKKQQKQIENQDVLISALQKENVELKSIRNIFSGREKRQVETVGFTAYLDHRVNVHNESTIKFNQVLYNDANAYNVHTGVFTVPITGTYIVSFQIEDWQGKEVKFKLMVDGMNTVDAILTANGSTQSGNTAVLHLTAGQSVWIETGEGYVFGGTTFRGTTFCAGLLYY